MSHPEEPFWVLHTTNKPFISSLKGSLIFKNLFEGSRARRQKGFLLEPLFCECMLYLCWCSVHNTQVFEWRKINFWLSVQVFGCPYLEYRIYVQRLVLATDFMVVQGQLHQYFGCSMNIFGSLGFTDSQTFEHWCTPWCFFLACHTCPKFYAA